MTQWLAARARNALRRPLRIIGVSTCAFIAALLTVILIPHEANRSAARLLEGTTDRPDTLSLARGASDAQGAANAAAGVLDRHRVQWRARQEHPALFDSLLAAAAPTQLRTPRDSVVAEIAELNRLLARSERSPLTASYRDLGAAAALQGDPRVPVLLDSLADVERARTAFDAAGGVDPIFVTLTARVNAIGHAIQAVAASRRATLRRRFEVLGGPPTSVADLLAATDTLRPRQRLDATQAVLAVATASLDSARGLDSALDVRAARAREIASESAPPIALMGAALVLGLAVGFAVTLGFELHTPRVADASEAARVAGAPTLATIVPHPPDPQRTRRDADQTLSPLIDASSESYRYVYLRTSERAGRERGDPSIVLRATGAGGAVGGPVLAVAGDEAEIVATVAANVAIAAVHDSRSTLLIDADPIAAAVAGIVGVRRSPGVSEVLGRRIDWSAAIVSAVVGRDQTLDVIPAGGGPRPLLADPVAAIAPGVMVSAEVLAERVPSLDSLDEASLAAVGLLEDVDGTVAAELRAEVRRLSHRYEYVVVAAPAGAVRVGPASILPVVEAIVCARIAYTTLDRLAASVTALRDSGLTVRGLVLWDSDITPRLAAQV